MGRGIDYGMGETNIDRTTGIRFGVISQNDVLQAWADSSEPDYGEPTCGKCGNAAEEYDDELHGEYKHGRGCSDYACDHCGRVFGSDDAYGDEPNGETLDDGEYTAVSDDYGDILIIQSPYYTHAAFCSPCAPGACHLGEPHEDGERAYCFGHDWFDGGKAPYPVFRVSDGSIVAPE